MRRVLNSLEVFSSRRRKCRHR